MLSSARAVISRDRRDDPAGRAVHLADRRGDPTDGRLDGGDRGRDLGERGSRLVGERRPALDLLRARLHRLDGGADDALDFVDEPGDLLRRAAGALGELADLVGDDREALPHLARAGRLDGGVEGEEVGLLGDVVDRLDDRADLLALRGDLGDPLRGGGDGDPDPVHPVDGARDGVGAAAGGLADPGGRLGDLGGCGGRVADDGAEARRRARSRWTLAADLAGGAETVPIRSPRRPTATVVSVASRACSAAPAATWPIVSAIWAVAFPAWRAATVSDLAVSATPIAGAADLADGVTKVLDHGRERPSQCVTIGPRLERHGEVIARDPVGGIGGLPEVADHRAEGAWPFGRVRPASRG